MTRFSIALLMMSALAGLSACATPKESMAEHNDRMAKFVDRTFMRLDLDRDEIITTAEIEAGRQRQFANFDTDGNGVIERDEIDDMRRDVNARRPEPGESVGRTDRGLKRGELSALARMDRNGDGRISTKEFTGTDARLLDMADFDGNGSLSRAELEDGMERMAILRRRR